VEHKEAAGPLFSEAAAQARINAMNESVSEIESAMKTLREGSPWDKETKVSDRFLPAVFEKYFEKLNLPNVMLKKNYHVLARFVPRDKIDKEVSEKLNAIEKLSQSTQK